MNAQAPLGDFGSGMSPRQLAAQCEARLRQGVRSEELLRQMAEAGCPHGEAEQIIHGAASRLRGAAKKTLGLGILLLALGILVTVATYRTACEAGGGRGFGYLVYFTSGEFSGTQPSPTIR